MRQRYTNVARLCLVPMLISCSLLCLSFLSTPAHAMGSGSLFTSTANIHKLFTTQQSIGALVRDVISQQEVTLGKLKRLADQLDASIVPESDEDLEPEESFALINRLYETREVLQGVMDKHEFTTLNEALTQTLLPSSDDLKGAAQGLLRLQRVYDLQAHDLLPHGTMSEAFTVAKEAYDQDDFLAAKSWLDLALAKARGEGLGDAKNDESTTSATVNSTASSQSDSESTADVSTEVTPDAIASLLDYASFVEYRLGNIAAALSLSKELLTHYDSTNLRVANNIEHYLTLLANTHQTGNGEMMLTDNGTDSSDSNHSTASATTATLSTVADFVKDVNHEVDNVLGHDEDDMRRFRKLCQGKVLYKPRFNLYCRFETYGKPHLMYQPIRAEYLHNGRQRLRIFRDFATPNECKHLRREGGQRLERAVAWTHGKFRPVTFRISTAAWLKPDHDEVVQQIHRRIADAVNIDIEHAEALQVSNYGMGGFYEPHFDHSDRDDHPDGKRLATFMIYLNKVKKGGFTAFPRLAAAVPPGHGDAVFWFNLLPSGQGDTNTLHGACPVLSGSKWVANKWIHERNNVCRKPYPHERV
eukprot:m.104072 g.104072  ORF g.104072 m.104072 type:complete len:587 (+) comp13253_c1_seq2:594-2354(+)